MNENVEIDLRGIVKLLLKRVWIIILCAAVLGAAVLVYTVNFVVPQYKASVTIYVNNNSGKENTYISSADLAVALRLVTTYVNIIQSDRVLDKVIEETNLQLTANQVRGMISAEVVGETEMFKVTVNTPYPQMSMDLANAIAAIAPGEISDIIEGSSAKIIDYARLPKSSSSPNYTNNTIIGAVVGAVLAVLVIVVQNLLDVRVKSEEDLEKIAEVPVLGVIPELSTEKKASARK